MKLTKEAHKDLKEDIETIRFQDEFFMKAIKSLQRRGDQVRQQRVLKMWDESKRALESFAKCADLRGMKQVIDERQRFIDMVIVGKIKLFDVPEQ